VLVVPWPEIITTGSVSSSAAACAAPPCRPCRHLDVEQHEVRASRCTSASASCPERADECVVLVLEDHPQRVADGRLVVDDQDARFQTIVDLDRCSAR
jgi:hypothetical protein